MLDRFKRDITYLRVSVTDRCNLRCTYCMPADGIELMRHEDILSLEDIYETVKIAASKGVTKVRLTGGEPLVRKGITDLVRMIASIPEITDLAMTTNGILLSEFAKPLKQAGLQRINISLDTMSPERYAEITRGGDISKVFAGIEAARVAELFPIKINCVVFKHRNEKDALEVTEFCKNNNLEIRYIHQMDLASGEFSIVEGGEGGNCKTCNRMRLTADGNFKPCLFDEKAFNVKATDIETAFETAIYEKPKAGSKNNSGKFYSIGG